MEDERLLVNRQNWNERTPVHAATEFYDVEGFKSGRITLTDVERREVGDVDGKTLLHLQCHFGLDTMSWARLGAKATGVDFSDAAIDLARSLNDEMKLDTRFIRSDVYDLPDVLDEEFDIVFTSYGVLVWLPDLDRWASTIQRLLRPGRDVLHRRVPSVRGRCRGFGVGRSARDVRLLPPRSVDPGKRTKLRRSATDREPRV